jgi:hypothetical protein
MLPKTTTPTIPDTAFFNAIPGKSSLSSYHRGGTFSDKIAVNKIIVKQIL